MILKAFIWISKHGPGGADVSDGRGLRFDLNARPTASQGEAPATAIGNMGRGQREESSAKGRRVVDSQSNLPAFKKKRLHKILDKCSGRRDRCLLDCQSRKLINHQELVRPYSDKRLRLSIY